MLRTSLWILAAIALTGTQAAAQLFPGEEDIDVNAAAAYAAITTTPLGALPASVNARMIGLRRTGVTVRAQFGHMDEEGPVSYRVFALGADVPFGRGNVGLKVGRLDVGCDESEFDDSGIDLDCKGVTIAGVDWGQALLNNSLSADGTTSLVLGLDATLGYGTGDFLSARFDDASSLEASITSVSASAGLPLALAAKSGRATVVPHLTPRFAYGRQTAKVTATGDSFFQDEEGTESGTRFMLGGGVDMFFSSVGVNIGFQKAFIKDGKTLIGVGLSYGLR